MERIQLSNETFEGNNNAYLFADGPETVLVDTGDRVPGTREQLERELERHGTSLADIDRILLTHWHGDHRGLAGPIQEESGAEVYVHSADAPLVSGDADAWHDLKELQERYFEEWGMPEEKRAVLREILNSVAWKEQAPEVTTLEDGDTISFNDRSLDVVHAPGHTAGLCMFETTIDGNRDVLSSDALLPKYTPNVGGADIRVERALAKYLRTLRQIADAEYDRAWPGHRETIADPAARAERISEHHAERSYRVLDALRRHGLSDAWTVSDDLFGELEHIHILHGPGESYAHLEHLEHDGVVVREGDDYKLADGVEAQLEAQSEEYWPLEIPDY
jgi:glyoxylase-like metal-dependent hydrolase (beta-lactamase superfamily II)